MPGYISEGATWEGPGSEAAAATMARPGEVERDRATEVLERTVAERTAQLQETVAELEAFSYSVSHDMRSSLRAMQNYAQGLLEDYGSKLDSKRHLRRFPKIQRACHRLDLQIRDLLLYSRIAKSQIELKPIRWDRWSKTPWTTTLSS